MKQFKRARISIVRQPSKSLILFAIILILGIFSASAISIAQAIQNTEINLLRRIPPVATVAVDMDAINEYEGLHGEWVQLEAVTRDILEAIGSLSYVRAFDFADYAWLVSSELELPMDMALYSDVNWFDDYAIMQLLTMNSRRTETDIFEEFVVKGVHNPAVIDLEEGIIELLAGRVFTQPEMDNDSLVVMVSQAFADANQLSVGSTIILESHIYETFTPMGVFHGHFDRNEPNAPLLEAHEFELEVVGIFTPTVLMEDDITNVDLYNHVELNARLYVPIGVVESSHQRLVDYIEHFRPESVTSQTPLGYWDVIFALYDSLDIANFYEAASALLPDFWRIDDLRREFTAMSNSLVGLQGISTGIMIGVSIASIVVLGLLILLFLHDRKEEVGVYLALGDARKNIVIQMLLETVIISMIALSISLFIGNMIANTMTYSMLRQDLVYNPLVFPNQDMMIQCFNRMGFSIQMTAEEMLAAYDVTLDGMTILVFSGVAIAMIVLSTILPIIYLTRLKPKDILIKSSIG